MEWEHHVKKDILEDPETIIEDEFGEEWERETAPPPHILARMGLTLDEYLEMQKEKR